MTSKKKLQTQQEACQPEIELSQDEGIAFQTLENLFDVHEDNWHLFQDEKLLNLINDISTISDSLKIKYLLKRYRDTCRDMYGV